MLKNLIILPDGTEIASGTQGACIRRLSLTQAVNSGRELTLGSACAAMLELTLQLPPEISLQAGDAVHLYRVSGQERYPVGVFLTQEPEHRGGGLRKLTAYDRMTLTDRDVSSWLNGLTGWPYTLQQLAAMVCSRCGVELVTGELPNGGLPVQAFSVRDVTGRQLLQWIGELTGRFCRMDALGRLEFGWYTPAQRPLGPTPAPGIQSLWESQTLILQMEQNPVLQQEALLLSGVEGTLEQGELLRILGPDGLYYYPGGLSLSAYAVAPVERVQLQINREEAGTVWPLADAGTNTYTVCDNPLVGALSQEGRQLVARGLYEQLHAVTYTPCRVCLPADLYLEPGKIVTVTDRENRTAQVYVMSSLQAGSYRELVSTGSARRDTAPVLHTYRDLAGKTMQLGLDVDGLKLQNRDRDGALAAMQLDVEGIRTRVEGVQETQDRLSTQISQTAKDVSVFINRVETEGAQQVTTRNGYTFSDQGLQIRRSGESVQSLLTHTGLQVTRDGQTLLQADKDGVRAVDVTVGNYLILGSHARLEDYPGDRTACYYI